MDRYFSDQEITNLHAGHARVLKTLADLHGLYLKRTYKNDHAREFAHHGFLRRVGTLAHAIQEVFEILPPERDDIPDNSELKRAAMALQSSVLNTYGCLDNLAWVWVFEKPVTKPNGNELNHRDVGLGEKYKRVRATLSPEFNMFLNSNSKWIDHITDFRDALAHRIPLYIPPYIIDSERSDEFARLEVEMEDARRRSAFKRYDQLQDEQRQFIVFRPWMKHTLFDNKPGVAFHEQLIINFDMINQFGCRMYDELNQYASD